MQQNVFPFTFDQLHRLIRIHVIFGNEVTRDQCGAAGAARLAMHVHAVSGRDDLLDEFDPVDEFVLTGRFEDVGGRKLEEPDSGLTVFVFRVGQKGEFVGFVHGNDAADAFFF